MSGGAANVSIMPSSLHEVLIELFRKRPALAAELLADALDLDLPGYEQARVEPGELTDVSPTEYRADTVVVLTAAEQPVLAVVVEVQLWTDEDKRWTWPVYLTTLRRRLRCPTVLLVVCVNATIAAWSATPIELGHPGARLVPLVLGPDRVPVVTDAEQAGRVPELAVLSAMAHGADPNRSEVLDVLPEAFAAVGSDRADLYYDIVLAALPAAAQRYLEVLVKTRTYEYQSDFARRYFSQGEAKGEAKGEARGEVKAVLAVLDARGIDVPDDVRIRITECADLDQLDTWVRRAATATSAGDLFE